VWHVLTATHHGSCVGVPAPRLIHAIWPARAISAFLLNRYLPLASSRANSFCLSLAVSCSVCVSLTLYCWLPFPRPGSLALFLVFSLSLLLSLSCFLSHFLSFADSRALFLSLARSSRPLGRHVCSVGCHQTFINDMSVHQLDRKKRKCVTTNYLSSLPYGSRRGPSSFGVYHSRTTCTLLGDSLYVVGS